MLFDEATFEVVTLLERTSDPPDPRLERVQRLHEDSEEFWGLASLAETMFRRSSAMHRSFDLRTARGLPIIAT